MPQDDLAQVRALRDDLRALKKQYPELTTPAAQRRLEDYMRTQEDTPMPAKGDRTLGEDLATVTFKIPKSALEVVDTHLRAMQRSSRWQRIGKSDALRDLFLRGVDSVEHPTPQFPVVLDAPQLPLPSARADVAAHALAALAAAGEPDMPPAPAASYEARAMDPEVPPESPLTVEHPLELDLEDTPLARAVDVTQESVVPEADSRPQPARRQARRQPMPPEAAELEEMPLAPAQAVKAAAAAKRQATPKRTTRTTKGRK